MSYCLNPNCPHPSNHGKPEQCQTCGAPLRLKGRYRALKPIGQGGFGRTFLAVDEGNGDRPSDEIGSQNSLCVIKQFLPQQRLQVSEIAALFQQEAMQLKELGKHAQIPQLLDYGSEGDQQFLIQQYIDGQNLAQELEETGSFDQLKIRELLLDLLPVLQFIHEGRVIHRDIKPNNIIRSRQDGTLFLVDLGAAKSATETALVRTGTVIGSAEFTAPEQARGKATFASDLYSLGVTCIHLLTQVSPFDLYDTGEGHWVWRDFVKQSVGESLGKVLDKLIEPATRRRYQSATEAIQDLQSLSSPLQEDGGSRILSTWPQVVSEGDRTPIEQPVDFAPNPPKPIDLRQLGIDATLERTAASAIQRAHEANDIQPRRDTFSKQSAIQQKRSSFWVLLAIALGLLAVLTLRMNVFNPPQSEVAVESSPASAVPDESTRTIETGAAISSVAVDADGSIVLEQTPINPSSNPSSDSSVSVWNPATGDRVRTFPNTQLIYSANYQPLPYLLTTGTNATGPVQLKNASNRVLTSLSLSPIPRSPMRLVLSQDQETLMGQTFSDNSKLILWNFKTGREIRTIPTQGFMPSAISPTGSVVAIADANTGAIDLLNVQTNRKARSLDIPLKPREQIVDLRFNLDGKTLLVAVRSANGESLELQFRQVGSGKLMFSTQVVSLNSSEGFAVPFIFHPDGSSLFTFSPDGTLVWRNAITGNQIRSYSGFQTFLPPAISRDRQSLAWIQNDPYGFPLLKVMDVRTGTVVRSLRGLSRGVNSIAFSKDGRQVFTGDRDGKLQIWSVYQFPRQ